MLGKAMRVLVAWVAAASIALTACAPAPAPAGVGVAAPALLAPGESAVETAAPARELAPPDRALVVRAGGLPFRLVDRQVQSDPEIYVSRTLQPGQAIEIEVLKRDLLEIVPRQTQSGAPAGRFHLYLRVPGDGAVLLAGGAAGYPAYHRVASAPPDAEPYKYALPLRTLAAGWPDRVVVGIGIERSVNPVPVEISCRTAGALASGPEDAAISINPPKPRPGDAIAVGVEARGAWTLDVAGVVQKQGSGRSSFALELPVLAQGQYPVTLRRASGEEFARTTLDVEVEILGQEDWADLYASYLSFDWGSLSAYRTQAQGWDAVFVAMDVAECVLAPTIPTCLIAAADLIPGVPAIGGIKRGVSLAISIRTLPFRNLPVLARQTEAAIVEANKIKKGGIYILKDGDEVVYVGKTNDFLRRSGEHKAPDSPKSGLDFGGVLNIADPDLRAGCEQVVFEYYGGKALQNKINPISPKNKKRMKFYERARMPGSPCIEYVR
ncbi:MAG: GIY-YIG nuclease family protein [Candidatus Sericytochromatia bacterium]|nr:GIY-YIG nuclease family protein [Candidatus Tanganyikabacteria bacterium]